MSHNKNKKSTLSLCMIVRDEEKNIRKSLESVKDLVDEIIIVDTGSKDNTVKIAEEFEASVYFYEWNDDFSAARNESLKYANGDWILVLDADEIIDKKNKKKLKTLIKKKEKLAYYLNFKSRIEESGAGGVVYNAHPRLFQNRKGILYQGKLHEEIVSSVQKAGGELALSDIEIEHSGYEDRLSNQKDKTERNIKILLKEIAENPDSGMNYFYLGESYSLLHRWEEAVEYYEKGAEKGNIPDMNLAILYQNLGTALLHQKKYGETIKSETRAGEINPNITTSHIISAQAAYETKNYDKSIWELYCYLEKIKQKDIKRKNYVVYHEPNLSYVYTLLGRSYLSTNNFEMAEKCLLKAEETDGIFYLLYCSALGNNDIKKAEEYIKKAIKLNSKFVGYYAELGNILIKQKRFDESEEVFKTASGIEPENKEILKGIGLIYLNEKNYTEAISEFEKIKEKDVEVQEYLAESYFNDGQISNARKILEDLLGSGVKKQNYYYFMGLILEASGETKESNELFRQAVEWEGGSSEIYFIAGNKLLNAELYDDAANAYNKSIMLTPLVKEPRMNLALTYIKKKELQKALDTYFSLLKIDPAYKKVKRNIASVYAKMGDTKNAEKYLLESRE